MAKLKELQTELKRRTAMPLALWFVFLTISISVSVFISNRLMKLELDDINSIYVHNFDFGTPQKIWVSVPWSPQWQELEVLKEVPSKWSKSRLALSTLPLIETPLKISKLPLGQDSLISLGKGANALKKYRELHDLLNTIWSTAIVHLDSGALLTDICAQTSLRDTLCLSNKNKVWQDL
jgi:hypothetical protein